MLNWWYSLPVAEQIFYLIAGVSTLVFILQLLAILIGMGLHDIDVDSGGISHDVDVPPGDVDLDHPDMEAHSSGLGMLSIRTVLAFMVGFGWTGVVAMRLNGGVTLSVVMAMIIGFLFMILVFYLMRGIYSLADSGNLDFRNAVGQSGTVYIPVPADEEGTGQVQVVVQGRMREIPAVTHSDSPLQTGTPIKVVKVLDGGTLLVKKLDIKEDTDGNAG